MSAQSNLATKMELNPRWIDCLEQSFFEVFDRMLGIHAKLCHEGAVTMEITSMIGYGGSLCGLMTIRCSLAAATEFTCRMLGVEKAEKRDIHDALGEICNMVGGSFKSKIPGIDATCMLSIPTTIAGSNYRVHPRGGAPKAKLVAECNGHNVQVMLYVNS